MQRVEILMANGHVVPTRSAAVKRRTLEAIIPMALMLIPLGCRSQPPETVDPPGTDGEPDSPPKVTPRDWEAFYSRVEKKIDEVEINLSGESATQFRALGEANGKTAQAVEAVSSKLKELFDITKDKKPAWYVELGEHFTKTFGDEFIKKKIFGEGDEDAWFPKFVSGVADAVGKTVTTALLDRSLTSLEAHIENRVQRAENALTKHATDLTDSWRRDAPQIMRAEMEDVLSGGNRRPDDGSWYRNPYLLFVAIGAAAGLLGYVVNLFVHLFLYYYRRLQFGGRRKVTYREGGRYDEESKVKTIEGRIIELGQSEYLIVRTETGTELIKHSDIVKIESVDDRRKLDPRNRVGQPRPSTPDS